MNGAKKSTWIGGTVFAALAIMAAAWFLAIAPTFSTASQARDQASATRQQNDQLLVKMTTLKADFARLPEYQADLAAIRLQVPADAQLAAYIRQVTAVAKARSVTITAISAGTPVTFEPPVPVVVAAPAAAPTSTTGEASPAPATEPVATVPAPSAPVASGPAAPLGFTTMPLSITVIGSYARTIAFLDDVQKSTPRLFLVAGLAGTALTQSDANGGKPATSVGDQELTITGFAYVQPDPVGATS
ncbi:hypothetical protein [Pengzhenrongella sp.]|jgi:Tfp pilus assembly protein PilO|uniref:hypothetical protein n=1 Tax=Pengzhenrongella sp. TaxID=2888820 RepID=UPI002F9584FE